MAHEKTADVERTPSLLLSSLRFWEVEHDLIEERLTAMRERQQQRLLGASDAAPAPTGFAEIVSDAVMKSERQSHNLPNDLRSGLHKNLQKCARQLHAQSRNINAVLFSLA
jgi:hypothetical protein